MPEAVLSSSRLVSDADLQKTEQVEPEQRDDS
jgi:hypothetical protein